MPITMIGVFFWLGFVGLVIFVITAHRKGSTDYSMAVIAFLFFLAAAVAHYIGLFQ